MLANFLMRVMSLYILIFNANASPIVFSDESLFFNNTSIVATNSFPIGDVSGRGDEFTAQGVTYKATGPTTQFFTTNLLVSSSAPYALMSSQIDDNILSFGSNNYVDAIGFYIMTTAPLNSLWAFAVKDRFGGDFFLEVISDNMQTPTYFGFLDVSNGISSVSIHTDYYDGNLSNFLLDDVSRSAISTVPLPATLPLLASALGVLSIIGIRKKA